MIKRDIFIRALAEFLSKDIARKSIDLRIGKQYALEWAAVRNATPVFGYRSVEETEKMLREFLLGEGK